MDTFLVKHFIEFANVCSFLFASPSHPCWINLTRTCTSFLWAFFGYLCQWLLIFACQSFSFQLNYLDHTHFLHNKILFLTLIAMMEPTPAKLHPTCANDHDGVRLCHRTVNALAIAVLRERHIYYDKQCVDWKISFCPRLTLTQTKWTSKSSREAYLFWKAAQAVAGKHIVIMQWFST